MASRRNAGIKRNRRPTGSIAVERKIYISEETNAALDRAREESGNLSAGLYLELLAQHLIAQHGAMPVLSPALDTSESPVAAA